MILLAAGCSYRTTAVAVREKLAVPEDRLPAALGALAGRLGCEAVILSTCNRVELYLGRHPDSAPAGPPELDAEAAVGFLAEFHRLPAEEVRPHLYVCRQAEAVRHLFRVAASLDSMLVGEGQIAGQVKKAYECALANGSTGPLFNALFPHARQAARRVRTETGIAKGHVSVPSAAVDYVRQVFDHFGDKTVLVLGAGKMGELTLRHLRALGPRRILVTNRSPEKAHAVAAGCGGEAVPWDRLDDVLARADIVLSTTGAPEPVVTRERYARAADRRAGGPVVILDIAVPRDFDPAIHDGDRTCLFNIDDLKRIREATLADRRKHVGPAEAIVAEEAGRFLREWGRRRHGPVIALLKQDFEAKRQEILRDLFKRLNGRLSDADRDTIAKAFDLLEGRFLNGPIRALREESHADAPPPGGHTLLDALRKLFRLQE
jgi:glutamyl-tRNA reductase